MSRFFIQFGKPSKGPYSSLGEGGTFEGFPNCSLYRHDPTTDHAILMQSASRTGWSTLRNLTSYQWFVFFIACAAWDLDCMDQQLFNVARVKAMEELLPRPNADDSRIKAFIIERGVEAGDPAVEAEISRDFKADVKEYAGYATSIFLFGWAIGGIGFGILGDRIGRVKTLSLTILTYSLFTGLSAFSVSFTDFAIYRFLMALGVGESSQLRSPCWRKACPTMRAPSLSLSCRHHR